MKNLSALLSVLLLAMLNAFGIQSQDEILQVRSSAFFSRENHTQLAINIVHSLDVYVYVDGRLTSTLVPSDPDASRVIDLAWNSTGELLAALITSRTGANDHWLVWDLATQEPVLNGYIGYAIDIEWHPVNSNRLTVTTGVHIYDIEVETESIREVPRTFDGIAKLSWNSSGSHLAVLEDIGRVYILSEADYTVDFRIDENVPLSERRDFYFSFTWSPDNTHFALYDMLDTEIEIWDATSGSFEMAFPSFDERPQHAEGILWTNVGIVAYVDTNDMGLYDAQTGRILNLINQERNTFFWDDTRQNLVYVPILTEITDVSLEILPLDFNHDNANNSS